MIERMTKYSFILLGGQKEDLLERLRSLGLMDITRASKPVDAASREMLSEIELLGGLVEGLKKARVPEGTAPEKIDGDIVRLAGGMLMRYNEDLGEIKELEKEEAELTVWGSYNKVHLDKLAEAGVPIHFHTLEKKQFRQEWQEDHVLSVANETKSKVWFIVAGEDSLPGEIPPPRGDIAAIKQELADKKAHFEKVLSRIAGAKERIGELEKLRDEACSRLDVYLANAAAVPAAEDTIETLEGYAPSANDGTLKAALDELGVFYFTDEAKAEDNPPISLKNNWFTRQFEVITKMYGSPVYNEFDPTPILGPFFMLFFALCMGDAGYGLLLVLIGWLLKKKVPSMADLGPLVMMLGGATFLVGIVLHTFFGLNIAEAAWVPEWLKKCMITGTVMGYDAQMVLAIIIGVFHICLANLVKAVCYTCRDGFLRSLGTWGWTLLIIGGVVIGGLALAGVIEKPIVKIAMIALGCISGVGIFLLNDIKRNPLLNIGAGLWDTYNTATGLLGDTLSYLRLYALGLAGGMLGNTFDMLAGMSMGISIPGVNILVALLILLLGHTINIALSCLGAFVHPLRLTFVEYFKNSGFEGTGREYKPLK